MPTEHETPPPSSPPSPSSIIATALQRAAHTHALCPPDGPPDEDRSQALAEAYDALNTSPDDVVPAERLADNTIEGLSISDMPAPASLSDPAYLADLLATQRLQDPRPASAIIEEEVLVVVEEEEETIQEKTSDTVQPLLEPATSSKARAQHPEPAIFKTLPLYSSSFLRPGSKFAGTQQSDRQQYNVQVEIKYVDMAESFLCGYLRIEGLTADHPTLTTYFEGEIIGSKYTFQTKDPSWGSSETVDMQHWNRFPAWKPLSREARRPDFTYKDYADREHLFMRWKEYFLIPDHRVKAISGASFEGFYYICFNQRSGDVSGIYFHAKSEKYQQLELQRVEDRGCIASIDFR